MAQVIKLVGIVDDGSIQNPRMPRNTAREIQFPRLGTVTIALDIFTNAGIRVSNGTNLVMTIQTRLIPGYPGPCLEKVGTVGPDAGVGVINIASADTQIFQASRLYYDVWLTLAGAKYQIIQPSILRLAPNFTRNP